MVEMRSTNSNVTWKAGSDVRCLTPERKANDGEAEGVTCIRCGVIQVGWLLQ